jgi:hypothetical protein
MMTDMYLIQLHGGPFDGYRHSVNYILRDRRLEMPGVLPCPDGLTSPHRAAEYELRRTSIELLDDLPTMVLDYHFVGMRVGMVSAAITKFVQWKNRFTRRLLRVARGPRDTRLLNTAQVDEPAQSNRQLTGRHSD